MEGGLNDDILREILFYAEYEIIINNPQYRELTDRKFWLNKYQYDLERSKLNAKRFFIQSCERNRVIYAGIYLSNLETEEVWPTILDYINRSHRKYISATVWRLFVKQLMSISAYYDIMYIIYKLAQIQANWSNELIIKTVSNPNFHTRAHPSSIYTLLTLLVKEKHDVLEAVLSNPNIMYDVDDVWDNVLRTAVVKNRLELLLDNDNVLSNIINSPNVHKLIKDRILPNEISKSIQVRLISKLAGKNQPELLRKVLQTYDDPNLFKGVDLDVQDWTQQSGVVLREDGRI